MRKLTDMRTWLALPEAVELLKEADSGWGEAELLRAALDGHLPLSVRFTASALAIDEAVVSDAGRQLEDVEPTVLPPWEIYDLVLEGGAWLDVENQYRIRSGTATVSMPVPCGIVVRLSGRRFRLVEAADLEGTRGFATLTTLPGDTEFVFNTSSLMAFRHMFLSSTAIDASTSACRSPRTQSACEPTTDEKTLGRKERTTLLKVLFATAKAPAQSLDKPSSAAAAIARVAEREGVVVSQRTIENHLKRAIAVQRGDDAEIEDSKDRDGSS